MCFLCPSHPVKCLKAAPCLKLNKLKPGPWLWLFEMNFFMCMGGGGGVIYIIYQTGFIVWLSDHPRKWKYRWRGGADFERKLFVTSVYQHLLLCNTIDARIIKPICMIPLCIQMVATYLKFFYIFQFWKHSDFSDFTQNAISLGIYHKISSNFLSVWGDVIYIIYQTGFIMWLSDHPWKWKYSWRGTDFERKLFVTSVYQHLLLHYWC